MTLRGLIEAIERGDRREVVADMALQVFAPEAGHPSFRLHGRYLQTWQAVAAAYDEQDMNAAAALNAALLPGWDWTMHGNGQAALWPPGSIDEQNAGCIEADIEGQPARALLLAILRALEGGEG
jgi:hypothetical protein